MGESVREKLPIFGDTELGVTEMEKQKRKQPESNIRLDPEQRLCSKFDSTSIAKFEVAAPGEMGYRVVDDCAEEHIM